jgi:hypothetical protein
LPVIIAAISPLGLQDNRMKKIIRLVLFALALALPVRALCSSAWVNRAMVGAQGHEMPGPTSPRTADPVYPR